jgi:transcriptional/translational regulatory protein YebC/TACO1
MCPCCCCLHVFFLCSVKAGGPDPVANSKLADLLKQAKDLGVPKDIIERNIKKASDAKQGDFQECIYEAYGPGGTGFIIEALTDNVNRTAGGRRHWRHASNITMSCSGRLRTTWVPDRGVGLLL